jgi:HlyD family secretion protein
MKKAVLVLLFVLAAVAVAIGGYYRYGRNTEPPKVATLTVSRGDISETVGATGTIEAVTTVQVGTQVSGTIKALYADFNSIVRKGQLIAELDPSMLETQVAQGRANLVRAQADVERLKVSLEDARSKLKRTRDLSARNLVPAMELESAETQVNTIMAQQRSAEAQVVQAQASLNQSEVNLQHTVIDAPIDGIVISRNVDVGQTVAASMQAPTLFIIAADLTKMRVVADIDESDVGRIRPGQVVRFRVDAHPLDEFTGTVTQIRLQPKVVQNVVTYATVIDVPNPQLKLKPGMTATVNVEIARRTDVLRVPVAALRFRPTNDIFAALNQEVPPELQRGGPGQGGGRFAGGGGGSPSAQPASPAAATGGAPQAPQAPATQPPAASPRGPQAQAAQSPTGGAPVAAGGPPAGGPPAGPTGAGNERPREGDRADGGRGPGGTGMPGGGPGGPPGAGGATGGGDGQGRREGGGQWANLTPEERRQRMQERMASMTPEERERFAQRMRERGIDPQSPGGGPGQGGGPGGGPTGQGPQGGPRAAGERRGPGATGGEGTAATSPRERQVTPASAQTIDSLFGPLPQTESSGRVWLYVGEKLKPARVRLGISDGTYTELISGEIEAGAELVSSVTLAAQAAASAPGRSPLMGPTRGPGGGPPGMGGSPGGGGGQRTPGR